MKQVIPLGIKQETMNSAPVPNPIIYLLHKVPDSIGDALSLQGSDYTKNILLLTYLGLSCSILSRLDKVQIVCAVLWKIAFSTRQPLFHKHNDANPHYSIAISMANAQMNSILQSHQFRHSQLRFDLLSSQCQITIITSIFQV